MTDYFQYDSMKYTRKKKKEKKKRKRKGKLE